ncbi:MULTISPECIES: NAD(+) diphosphatase [unclassified Roseitalea]|uniref:NAD(+) diphosphatase n=1 Tax=unclassified Roseitalea TaxID=2639107 RepID=UPI00273E0E99|nr:MULTISPECIES: NAD(+) diphosphatase [unclassified Roseitalea]
MPPIPDEPDAPEPSARTGFAGNRLERRSEKRHANSVSEALADPRARVLLLGEGRALLRPNGAGLGAWFGIDDADAFGARAEHAVLLGYRTDGAPALAAPVDEQSLAEGDLTAIDYRSIHMQGLLDAETLGALAQGAALIAWHRSHRFCSRCGHQSAIADGGYKRVCGHCQAQHFPRTDPVVIMLAVAPDGRRCLLGRSPHFPAGMYSCLAGFVEPGETLEDAVRRETEEEAGVRIGQVGYHASQPWPFPHTLMVGCYARALTETITVDDELEDARWFERGEIRAMIAGAHPDGLKLPPQGAIASLLIRDWL